MILADARYGRRDGYSAANLDCHVDFGPVCGELAFLERVSAEFRLWVGRMPDNHHELMSAVVGRCREDGADARIVGGGWALQG